MARCATCGGLLGPDAEWCGQCFAPVRAAAPERASPNGSAAADLPPPPPSPSGALGTSPLSPAAALAAIPPDIQITLAKGGAPRPSLSDRGKSVVTAGIVVVAAGSDALFFPFIKYMVIWGIFMGAFSGAAIWRLWARRTVKAR